MQSSGERESGDAEGLVVFAGQPGELELAALREGFDLPGGGFELFQGVGGCRHGVRERR